jgi:hypothetical protein
VGGTLTTQERHVSEFHINGIQATNLQVGDHNHMVVHQSVSRLETEVSRHRGELDDPSAVEHAVRDLRAEMSSPQPWEDRLTQLIGTIDKNAAGAPTVLQSLDEVRQMLGIS